MNQFEQGQVLVADMTDPDWEPIMTLGEFEQIPCIFHVFLDVRCERTDNLKMIISFFTALK